MFLESECGRLEGGRARGSSAFEVDEPERSGDGFGSAWGDGWNRYGRYHPVICPTVLNAYGAGARGEGALHDQLAARISAGRRVPMAHRARWARLLHAASANEVRRRGSRQAQEHS